MQRGHRKLRKGRWSIPHQVYHVTFATMKRRPTFTELRPARVVINCLRREVEEGHAHSMCFVLMPDHLHWFVQTREAKPLGIVINNLKSRSARGVNQALGQTGRVPQKGFYDRAIRESEDLPGIARYIVANPLRAGLVNSVRDYPHWDAEWL